MLACQISKWRGWIGNLIVWTPIKTFENTGSTYWWYKVYAYRTCELRRRPRKKRGKCIETKKNTGFHVLGLAPQSKMCVAHGSGSQCDTALPKRKARAGGGGRKTWWSSSPSSSSCYWAGEETSGFPQTATRRRIWQRTGGTGIAATMKCSRIFCAFIGIAFSAFVASEGELKVETLAESTNCEKVIYKPPF